jgi:hypothetical protein
MVISCSLWILSNFAGEGMKVGIAALLREDISVCHYTSSEIWNWQFIRFRFHDDDGPSKNLAIGLAPHEPMKAKRDPTLSDDVREARKNAKRHTTVILQGKRPLEIDFKDYLFLHPPSDGMLKTELGTILTSDIFRSKLFVKGIFVEDKGPEDPPALRYGVDLQKARLDRDRNSVMSGCQKTQTLAQIWDILIYREEKGAAEMYLNLLLEQEAPYEILSAKDFISNASAAILFNKLCLLFPNRHFYSLEDKDVSEVPRLKIFETDLDYPDNP